MKLLSFNIEIVHRPGTEIKVADAFSCAFKVSAVITIIDLWYKNKFNMV